MSAAPIEVTVTRLSMTTPPAHRQPLPLGQNVAMLRAHEMPRAFYRYLIDQVGPFETHMAGPESAHDQRVIPQGQYVVQQQGVGHSVQRTHLPLAQHTERERRERRDIDWSETGEKSINQHSILVRSKILSNLAQPSTVGPDIGIQR